ncbi:hypothetical protein K1719_034493 [Acacia pycnantha]|nr:hypothetical protein K1719_034493 [Acacia pycnantha]
MELVDPKLSSDFDKEEVILMIKVALQCTHFTPAFRPAMSSVVSIFEGKSVEETVSESSEVLDEKKLETMRMLYKQKEEYTIRGIQEQSTSATSTSTSASDLYPPRLDSSSC